MADKLAESTWSAFTRKHRFDLDDGALLKALARWDKTDDGKPGPRLDALKDLTEQINKQVAVLAKKKKELGDKPFALLKDKLDELRGLADAEGKLAERKQAEASAADGEEADSPVLLTTKMIPLVRELRKGEARMPALISLAGKETAVLIMRRPIAPTRRKLMQAHLQAQSGLKHIQGECVFEKNALTFVLASPAAGLAKRIGAALLQQLGLRLKVRVRGDDGVEDEDGEDADETPARSAQAEAAATPAAQACAEHLRKVRPRVEQALRDQHPASAKLRALIGFVGQKMAGGDHAGATQALQMIDQLLLVGSPAARPGTADPDPAFRARLAALIPRVKAAVALGGAAAQEARLRVSEAGVAAGKKQFEQANTLLDTAEALLSGAQAPSDAKTAAPSRPAAWAVSPGPSCCCAGERRKAKPVRRWRSSATPSWPCPTCVATPASARCRWPSPACPA